MRDSRAARRVAAFVVSYVLWTALDIPFRRIRPILPLSLRAPNKATDMSSYFCLGDLLLGMSDGDDRFFLVDGEATTTPSPRRRPGSVDVNLTGFAFGRVVGAGGADLLEADTAAVPPRLAFLLLALCFSACRIRSCSRMTSLKESLAACAADRFGLLLAAGGDEVIGEDDTGDALLELLASLVPRLSFPFFFVTVSEKVALVVAPFFFFVAPVCCQTT